MVISQILFLIGFLGILSWGFLYFYTKNKSHEPLTGFFKYLGWIGIVLIALASVNVGDKYAATPVGDGQESEISSSENDLSSEDTSNSEATSYSEETESSVSNSESDTTDTSSEAIDDSISSNFGLEDVITTNTDYSNVSATGVYVADPYTAVITIKSDDDKRIVISKVLGAFRDHAKNKLNHFDELNITVKGNGETLKTTYPISTIMYNAKVYRPMEAESLATSWSFN